MDKRPVFTDILHRLHRQALRRRKVQPRAKALLWDEAELILLIRHPQEGRWRLPGDFVRNEESAYDAVRRALAELAGVQPLDLTPIARIDESQFRPDVMYGDFFQMYSALFWVRRWRDVARREESPWEVGLFPSADLPHALHEEASVALKALRAFEETGQIQVF
jgi:ADP-ribose pyrophosphatase YjhB (NUDIX family)